MCTEPIIICGDLNFHVDDPEDTNASMLMDLLNSMDLVQHVGSSTQVSGHTLDLVITRKMDTIIRSQPVADCFLSDHATVICDLNLSKAPITSKRVSYRKLRAIDLDSLKEDLRSSRLCESPPVNLEDLIDCCNSTLASILDKHAPLRSRTITVRPRVPWFSNDIREAKRERRRAVTCIAPGRRGTARMMPGAHVHPNLPPHKLPSKGIKPRAEPS